MKYIGIVGSRRRDTHEDYHKVLTKVSRIWQEGDVLVSGGCPKGGDRFAEMIAKLIDARIVIFPADWKKYGKQAGFVRNTDIAKLADELIACAATDRTGGTEDTITKFKKFHPSGKVYLV